MMSSYRDCNRKYLNNNLNGIILDMENLSDNITSKMVKCVDREKALP